jgi:hypothetical protein
VVRLLLIFKIGGLESKGGLISLKKWPRAVAATLTLFLVLGGGGGSAILQVLGFDTPDDFAEVSAFICCGNAFDYRVCCVPRCKARAFSYSSGNILFSRCYIENL